MKWWIVLLYCLLNCYSLESNEVCVSLEDCQQLKIQVETRILKLLENQLPEMTEILEKGVSQYEAERICMGKGMRLPTARELARVAQSNGALGISEKEKDGYLLILASDSKGYPDYFYYSSDFYKPPQEGNEQSRVWTSSIHLNGPRLAFWLNDKSGEIEFTDRYMAMQSGVVRCVRSH